MRIDIEPVNILRISYHQDPGDPKYGSCLWAYFDFDLTHYMLNIQSDCGSAAYRWFATPDTEPFLCLMARSDGGYLMDKLFDADCVNVDATMENIKEQFDEDELPDYECQLDHLRDMLMDCGSPSEAQHIIDQWNQDNLTNLEDPWYCVESDHSGNQKKIIEIFTEHIQPKIRQTLDRKDVCRD